MKIDLNTDEVLEIVVDGTCGFEVYGERNEEGTMIIKSRRKEQ